MAQARGVAPVLGRSDVAGPLDHAGRAARGLGDALKSRPGEHEERVVLTRVPPRITFPKRDILELEDIAARVRRAAVAAGERTRSKKSEVARAGRVEHTDARTPGLAVRIGGVEPQGVEVIVGIIVRAGGVEWSR